MTLSALLLSVQRDIRSPRLYGDCRAQSGLFGAVSYSDFFQFSRIICPDGGGVSGADLVVVYVGAVAVLFLLS